MSYLKYLDRLKQALYTVIVKIVKDSSVIKICWQRDSNLSAFVTILNVTTNLWELIIFFRILLLGTQYYHVLRLLNPLLLALH